MIRAEGEEAHSHCTPDSAHAVYRNCTNGIVDFQLIEREDGNNNQNAGY